MIECVTRCIYHIRTYFGKRTDCIKTIEILNSVKYLVNVCAV